MNVGLLAPTLRLRAAARRHERWPRRELEAHVAAALRDQAITSVLRPELDRLRIGEVPIDVEIVEQMPRTLVGKVRTSGGVP